MRSLSPGAQSAWHPSLRPYYRGKICIHPHSPTPIIPLCVMKREREREVGVNQGVVRERRKDIRVQPIPPAPPASLTIFLDPKPFYPSNGNPEAYQYHINHIQCLWHSISANDAAMAAELPYYSSPRYHPAHCQRHLSRVEWTLTPSKIERAVTVDCGFISP